MSMSIGGIVLTDPKLPIKMKDHKPSLAAEFESNDVVIRELDTRIRTMLTLEWDDPNYLFHDQFTALRAFLHSHTGIPFTVILPYGIGQYDYMYKIDDGITMELVHPNMPEKGIIGMWKYTIQVGQI